MQTRLWTVLKYEVPKKCWGTWEKILVIGLKITDMLMLNALGLTPVSNRLSYLMPVCVATLCTVTYTVQSENKRLVHCKHNAFVVGNMGFLVVVVLGEWGCVGVIS